MAGIRSMAVRVTTLFGEAAIRIFSGVETARTFSMATITTFPESTMGTIVWRAAMVTMGCGAMAATTS
ncbi:hypothetical protein D3C85_1694180 [compost metagenome]